MVIRRLCLPDTASFRALRLEALLRHPQAFGDSHAEAMARAPAAFEALLSQAPPAGILGAFEAGGAPAGKPALVGMAGLAVPSHAKQCHKGMVWGVYVAVVVRGRGLGRDLLDAAVQNAQASGLEQLQLRVTADNATAMAVYTALGFRPYGLERHALRLAPGRYEDEVLMALDLQG